MIAAQDESGYPRLSLKSSTLKGNGLRNSEVIDFEKYEMLDLTHKARDFLNPPTLFPSPCKY